MTRDPSSTYVALLHHPMRDRTGAIVTTAFTTMDLHDMARTCRTFDIAGFFVVHPIEYQRHMGDRIIAHWADDGRHDFRRQALERVTVVDTLEAAEAEVVKQAGRRPRRIATTAKRHENAIDFSAFHAVEGPRLLLFGTGFGMTDELLSSCEHILLPLTGRDDYNHLSVRSACAIILDRLYGDEKNRGPLTKSAAFRDLLSNHGKRKRFIES